ncbi:MAG: ATP-binding cassette domain-containing protein [Clostridia bacterium]|nr:ATP-binding cassette domain-containing protein [Clostridia bacterium]
MSCIVFENVTKSFDGKNVLSSLSFEVKQREMLAIMGPSGCGKTTILNLILGSLKPDSGKISVPKKASVVFQEDRLFEEFSALSNVEAIIPPRQDKEHCAAILNALGIEDLKKPVRKLSGGMKRRVAIARALAIEADFYVLDEPFKGLDEDTKDEVIAFVKERLEGKTVVVVTHQKDEAEKLNARIMLLDKLGNIIE